MNSLELSQWCEIRAIEIEERVDPPRTAFEKTLHNLKYTTLKESYRNRWGRPYDKCCNSSDPDY